MALETLEFKDEDESVGPFRRRLFFVFSLVALCFLILACRLAWLQIINRDLYVERAEQNRTVTTTSQDHAVSSLTVMARFWQEIGSAGLLK